MGVSTPTESEVVISIDLNQENRGEGHDDVHNSDENRNIGTQPGNRVGKDIVAVVQDWRKSVILNTLGIERPNIPAFTPLPRNRKFSSMTLDEGFIHCTRDLLGNHSEGHRHERHSQFLRLKSVWDTDGVFWAIVGVFDEQRVLIWSCKRRSSQAHSEEVVTYSESHRHSRAFGGTLFQTGGRRCGPPTPATRPLQD